MFTAILFDFFDVIRTDAYKAWLSAHNYKLEGAFLEAAQKMDRGQIDTNGFLQILASMTDQSPEAIFAEMEASPKLDHKVLALIEKLGATYQIGLLSNASSAFLRDLLQKHDLTKHFDEIIISSEVGVAKPDAQIFRLALAKMNVEPNEAIFIDDNPHNTAAASALGVTSIVYTNIDQLNADLKKLGITTAQSTA